MSEAPDTSNMLWKESIANRSKHWVRCVTACSSKCMFCLDMDTPRNVYLTEDEVKADLRKGREELDAWKVILSGGEATLHPKFPEFCRYAREIGYGRVQCVTNGYRFGAEPEWYQKCIEAGLDEITFSLHGHTEKLHDHLTQHKGAFRNICKAILRAVRDPRVIVSVDVVINKQNVGVLDKIVELAIRMGVTEFDLLHVIPQAEAFRKRDQLFYNPRKYLPVLHKVFRLDRHPGFVIWTNRFPISFLEGMEDLIQDPHKMLDEVNGRRFHVRNYLDRGVPLECREQERCVHCFIEPFCTTQDRAIEKQNQSGWDVWRPSEDGWIPDDTLPYGCTQVWQQDFDIGELPDGAGVYVQPEGADPIPADLPGPATVVATTSAQLEAWWPIPAGVTLEVHLNRETAPWLLAHRDDLATALDQVRIHQPTFEHMKEAVENDVREPAAFFRSLDLPIGVSGLPLCNTPGAVKVPRTHILRAEMFKRDTGRFSIRKLSQYHIREGYYAKSVRCEDCSLNDRCDGMHVNMIRDQGLALLDPLTEGEWAEAAIEQARQLHPDPIDRIATGKAPEVTAVSLPGYPEAPEPPRDPLAIKEDERRKRREELKKKAAKEWAKMQADAK